MQSPADERLALPDPDRLSVLAAAALLAYAILPFVQLPDRVGSVQILGIAFELRVNFATLTALISAALSAAGMDWLLRAHPRLGSQSTWQHLILPAMTAGVIGAPLGTLRPGAAWWAVLALGGLLLTLVWVAEYIAVDPADLRRVPATVALTAVSFALFLTLAIALFASGARLYLLLPALGFAVYLVTLRTLHLRLSNLWPLAWAALITLLTVEITAALHYMPAQAVQSGLIVTAAAYALTSIAGSVLEERSWRVLWIEPLVMALLLLILAARMA